MSLINFIKSNEKSVSNKVEEAADGSDNTANQQVASNNELPGNVKKKKFSEDILNKTEKAGGTKDLLHTNYSTLAPCPIDEESTGLSEYLLLSLLMKHLLTSGTLTIRELAVKLCLSGGVVQTLIDKAKHKSWVENYASTSKGQLRFALSVIGKSEAEKEFLKNGYIGPAPVPLSQYTRICSKQTSRDQVVTNEDLDAIFSDLSFSQQLLDKIGPALNSTKPILIYGDAGTGKSYFCRHLNLVFSGDVLVPNAIEVNNEIIQVFDPEIHQVVDNDLNANVLKLESTFDPRWLKCKRPLVVSGGELNAELLEVRFDPSTKTYRAPLQLKANNGILLLDDLGRQKITPKELFNRWIIPLEERRDFLSLRSGLHFELPFELLLLFSTNLTPTELVDDAFLRRLGYKIEFTSLSKELYQEIWFKECIANNVICNKQSFDYLVDELHQQHKRKFLPCYPRDLISIISDQIKFRQLEAAVNQELLDFAWNSYFVK